jgi:DNA ligase-1
VVASAALRGWAQELVLELGFEAIAPSSRHKSGIAVRFARMLRWRKDKQASDADSLDSPRKSIAS